MRALLSLYVGLLFVASGQARSNTAPSIEWLADRSDAIGFYKVEAVQITSFPQAHLPDKGQWGRWGTAAIKLTLLSVKKGIPPAKVETEFLIHPTDSAEDIHREIAPDQQLACFLWKKDDSAPLELHHLSNLSSPSKHGPYTIFTSDFRILDFRADILSALDARLHHPGVAHATDDHMSTDGPPPNWVEVPGGTPAFGALYGGSICYLIIPEDLRAPLPPKTLQPTAKGGG